MDPGRNVIRQAIYVHLVQLRERRMHVEGGVVV